MGFSKVHPINSDVSHNDVGVRVNSYSATVYSQTSRKMTVSNNTVKD